MKILVGLLCVIGLLFAEDRPGDYKIRAEPTAKLQTQAPVPIEVRVSDSLAKPLRDADVSVQIETPDHLNTKVYKAPSVGNGVFLAKPVFPHAGQWNIYIQVRHNDQVSSRNFTFTVPD